MTDVAVNSAPIRLPFQSPSLRGPYKIAHRTVFNKPAEHRASPDSTLKQQTGCNRIQVAKSRSREGIRTRRSAISPSAPVGIFPSRPAPEDFKSGRRNILRQAKMRSRAPEHAQWRTSVADRIKEIEVTELPRSGSREDDGLMGMSTEVDSMSEPELVKDVAPEPGDFVNRVPAAL